MRRVGRTGGGGADNGADGGSGEGRDGGGGGGGWGWKPALLIVVLLLAGVPLLASLRNRTAPVVLQPPRASIGVGGTFTPVAGGSKGAPGTGVTTRDPAFATAPTRLRGDGRLEFGTSPAPAHVATRPPSTETKTPRAAETSGDSGKLPVANRVGEPVAPHTASNVRDDEPWAAATTAGTEGSGTTEGSDGGEASEDPQGPRGDNESLDTSTEGSASDGSSADGTNGDESGSDAGVTAAVVEPPRVNEVAKLVSPPDPPVPLIEPLPDNIEELVDSCALFSPDERATQKVLATGGVNSCSAVDGGSTGAKVKITLSGGTQTVFRPLRCDKYQRCPNFVAEVRLLCAPSQHKRLARAHLL